MNFNDALRGDEYLTNSEVEEMEATMAAVPDEDWEWYLSVSYVDPAERAA